MRNLKKKLDKGIIIFLPNNLSWIPRDPITSSNGLHLKISRFSSSRKRTRLTKRITFCVIIHKCNISRLNNISDPFQEFLSAIFLSKGRAGQRRWILNLPAIFKFSLPDSSHTSPPPCPGKKEADIAEGWNVISSWQKFRFHDGWNLNGVKSFSLWEAWKTFPSKYHRERPIITELKIRVNCPQFPNSSSGGGTMGRNGLDRFFSFPSMRGVSDFKFGSSKLRKIRYPSVEWKILWKIFLRRFVNKETFWRRN